MAEAINAYTKKTLSRAEYGTMRGTMDYSNAKLFNLFESGYGFIKILSRPAWLEAFATDSQQHQMLELFCWIIEYEFRGLDGIDDVTADNIEYTDGISTINTIGKVNKQSAAEISMTFTERSGLAITKFINYYLTGVKDPRTQAKTYHGLIAAGKIAGGFENEVFNMLYMVTDNTLLGLEKAYILANAWPSKAETSMLNVTKGDIDKKETTVTWQCFVMDGDDVDKLGLECLAYINEAKATYNYMNALYGSNDSRTAVASGVGNISDGGSEEANHLDSSTYGYNVINDNSDTFSATTTTTRMTS